MAATKGNGLDAANIQPAKTLTKYAADFIARADNPATADSGYLVLSVVVLAQALLMLLVEVLK